MQIYIYYFIRANIFMKKIGVGPDGQDPSSGFGFAPYPQGTFFGSIFRGPNTGRN